MGTSKPSRLLLLPSELRSAILENLQHDRSALLSVCLTCRILHATARPILNRRIVVHNHDRESYETAMGQLPQVTQYVRDLTIHSHIESKASVRPIPASMAGTYQPIDILAIKGYNPLFTDFVPTIDAMNRLEKLTIKGCGYIGAPQAIPSTASDLENLQHNLQTFNSLILRAVQGDSLRRLHTLEIDLCNRGNWYCEIEPFLYHPRLKKLSIMGASISGFRPMHSRLRFSPLEELGLVCCDLSSGTMEGLLSIPKALRRLTFGGSPRSQTRERLDYDTQLYVNAIKQQADSLEYLDISPPILLDERREPIDLRSLTALQSLRIRPRTLYGHFNMNPGLSSLSSLFSGNALPQPALPANLRLLRLWCWGVSFRFEAHTSILNNLDSFAVTEPIPSLRYVIIEDSKFVSGDWGVPWDNRGYLTFLGAEPQGPWRFPLDCCWADGA